MSMDLNLRPSPIAGRWYSGDPGILSGEVNTYLEQAEIEPLAGEVIGLVVPHAGHRYSGRTAGYGFRAVRGLHFDLAVVVSPFHDYHPAKMLVSGHQAYITPLGALEIDRQAVDAFSEQCTAMGAAPPGKIMRDQEHSLEIELPFLQTALAGGFKLLPLMLRDRSVEFCRMAGKALAAVLKGRSALLVASSDLSHFYPQDTATRLDGEMLKLVGSFSPEAVLKADAVGKAFACGANAIAVALWAAGELGADQVKILHHSTSAAETGDRSSVVGYGAAVILKTR
jgi:AmmeMemoRadiSam system protein B